MIESLEKSYDAYVDTFRGPDGRLPEMMQLKRTHTAFVVRNAEEIAKGEGFCARDRAAALAAALLHDTGRYEQLRRYDTFRDADSVDHAVFSHDIVKERGWLDGAEPDFADAVLKAVLYHNRRDLPDGMDHLTEIAAHTVRDADKLDIFRVLEDQVAHTDWQGDSRAFWNLSVSAPPNPEVVDCIENGRPVDYQCIKSLSDFVLIQVGWMVSGLHFATSRRLCRERGHLEYRRRFLHQLTDSPEIDRLCDLAARRLGTGLAGDAGKMRIWGITGTNGKTTTTWILAAFLAADPSRKVGYITTVEVFDGARRFYTGYTTPPLARLREIFAAMEANGCTDCVMEVSSHAIHQNRVGFGETTVFAGGAFTNLSEDHLDYHKTMEEYFRVKLSFAERIAADNARLRGWGEGVPPSAGRRDFPPYVVCMDGGFAREMLEACGRLPLNVIPVSAKSPRLDLSELPLVGDYNRSNTLVAAALAEAAGVPHEAIQAVVPSLTPRWGRLERVDNPSVAADVYVDFAHTPDGLEKVLSAVRNEMSAHSSARLWVVFGAGGDRDPMKRPLMGEACARLADRVVVTSDNPRSEDPMAIIRAILAGMPPDAPESGRVIVEPDRRAAIEFALSNAACGDVVVIAGKGHEATQEIAGVKHPFDDREVVRSFKGGAGGAS